MAAAPAVSKPAFCKRLAEGSGETVGEGLGVGVTEGLGVGETVGVGDGDGETEGLGDGEGLGTTVGLGIGVEVGRGRRGCLGYRIPRHNWTFWLAIYSNVDVIEAAWTALSGIKSAPSTTSTVAFDNSLLKLCDIVSARMVIKMLTIPTVFR